MRRLLPITSAAGSCCRAPACGMRVPGTGEHTATAEAPDLWPCFSNPPMGGRRFLYDVSVRTQKSTSGRLARAVKKARTACLDLRYGGLLNKSPESRYRHLGARYSANTDYDALPYIFPDGSIKPSDVLVDVGCGFGRVINWWLSRGLRNQIVGVELDPDIAAKTRCRLRRYANVAVVTGDVVELMPGPIPRDATVFYLFHPFERPAMQRFKARVEEVYRGRRLRLYYYVPAHADLFDDDPQWEVQRRSLGSPWPHRQEFALLTLQAGAA